MCYGNRKGQKETIAGKVPDDNGSYGINNIAYVVAHHSRNIVVVGQREFL